MSNNANFGNVGNGNLLIMKPPRIKKRVNVTIETIMEPEFERDDDDDIIEIEQSGGDMTPPRMSSVVGINDKTSPQLKKIYVRETFEKIY